MFGRSKKSAAVAESPSLGLAAIGSEGGWEIAIDESTFGTPERWSAQIEGPSIYLSFPLRSLAVVDEMIAFLTERTTQGSSAIELGKTKHGSASLVRDDESDERFFLMVDSGEMVVRVTFTGSDLKCLIAALRKAGEDVADDE